LNELNEFFIIFHAFFALISFFRKFLSLHFNRLFMIVMILKLFILILRNFSKMIEIETIKSIDSTFSIST
jgi:hypothetical protein